MMISEHHHGTFLVTLDPEETDRLTALIEGQETTEDNSPCCALLAEKLLAVFMPDAQVTVEPETTR